MAQGLVVPPVAATDLSYHHLHPGFTSDVTYLAEQLQRLLSINTCLLEISLFPAEPGQFVERPASLFALVLFTAQGQAPRETADRLSIFAPLVQKSTQAPLDLALTCFIAQAQGMPIRTAQHAQHGVSMATATHRPGC